MTEREQYLQRQDRLKRKPTAREVEAKQQQQVSDIDLIVNKQGWVTLYKNTNGKQKLVGVIQNSRELQSILKAAGVNEIRLPILLA